MLEDNEVLEESTFIEVCQIGEADGYCALAGTLDDQWRSRGRELPDSPALRPLLTGKPSENLPFIRTQLREPP